MDDTRPRLIVHAGFHKTGTSTVQRMLARGRRPLGRIARVLLKTDMQPLCAATRAAALRPSEDALATVQAEAAALFATLDPTDPRTVLISAEDLCGLIPGRHDRLGYPMAGPLLARLRAGIRDAWPGGPGAETFYFSTRAPDPWIRSCHAHHLRHTRLTLDLDSYRAQQAPAADLAAIAAGLAPHLPGAQLVSRPLEALTTLPLGPLAPLASLLDIPAPLLARLRPIRPRNTALPPDLLQQFLALNRSDLGPEALAQAKQALIDATRSG